MQIKKKLPLIRITLIYISLLILAFMSYVYFSKMLIVRCRDNMGQLARTEGRALEALVASEQYQVKLLASDERIVEAIEAWRAAHDSFDEESMQKARQLLQQAAMEDCDKIYIMDDKGNIVASSDEKNGKVEVVNLEAFKRVLTGESVFESMIKQDADNHSVDITVPIENQMGDIVGALCKVSDSSPFSEFVKEIKINKTGYAYIVDDQAKIIAHPDSLQIGDSIEDKVVKSKINAQASSEQMKESVVAGKEKGILKYMAFYHMPDVNWTMCMAQNADEIQKQVFMEVAMSMAIALFFIGLIHNITWYISRKNAKSLMLRDLVMDITSRKVGKERARRLVSLDILTGCLNKQAFEEKIRTRLIKYRGGQKAVLFFIDLDDFKKVNDALGHDVGDKLLNYVASEIKALLPAESVISRFGGDEFVIYKDNISGIEDIENLAGDILGIFKERIIVDPHVIHITCSIGIALYPLDGMSLEELLKNADTAMYKAKEQGKNSYSFYAEDMSKTLARKLMVEGALREAISEQKGLYLQYQPIVDAKTARTVGAEALIRLRTEDMGFISPAEFIPVAEETGLIVEVGDWVMRNALQTLGYYRENGYDNFSISINVSPIQMQEADFMQKLKCYIEEVDVPPKCVKLEVTETVLMQNLERSKVIFGQIKEWGIKLALDDFGTGYSSLNYLRNIPLDVLKIDKSFIDEITISRELSEIVDSIINMAHILNIDVVAEGVESEEQLELLRRKGCDLIQGYVFSKPLMGEALNGRLQGEKDEKIS